MHPIKTIQDVRRIEKNGASAWMPHTNLWDALSTSASQHSESLALAEVDLSQTSRRGASWTYAELTRHVAEAAEFFSVLVRPETPRVALLAPPTSKAWITLLASECSGIAIPINHALSIEHLTGLLQASKANVVAYHLDDSPHGVTENALSQLRQTCPSIKAWVAIGRHIGAGDKLLPDLGESPAFTQRLSTADLVDSTVALYHTGGTTGLPKLVQHTATNQLFASKGAAAMYGLGPADGILNGFPLFHVAGAFVYGLSALLSGSSVWLPPVGGWRNPEWNAKAWATMETLGITVLAMVPTVMSILLGQSSTEQGHRSLRLALTGGSPLPEGLAAEFEARTELPVRNILGMTETGGVIAIEPAASPRKPGSCGLPIPFCRVTRDEASALCISGLNVSPGYTDPTRNLGVFENGVLNSGDLGEISQTGEIYVTGRAKDLIIRGAHNIDPSVIEEALAAHPSISLGAAVGMPDAYAGEVPVAFAVRSPSAVVEQNEVIDWLATRITEKVAIPKEIFWMDSLPQTSIGKIYKPELRRLAAAHHFEHLLNVTDPNLADALKIAVYESGGSLSLVFNATKEVDRSDLSTQLASLMKPYAWRWELT
ncbi:MAG: AMP-binding protein [Proteobacteria bacterium]|nr:AMP-binding protein [Pseudomonadota bacterium]